MDFNIWGRFWPTIKMLSIFNFYSLAKLYRDQARLDLLKPYPRCYERTRRRGRDLMPQCLQEKVLNRVPPIKSHPRVVPKKHVWPFQGLDWKCLFGWISFLGGTGVKSNKLKSRYVDLFNFQTGPRTQRSETRCNAGFFCVGPTLPSAVKRRAINLDVGNYHGWPKN